MLPVVRTEQAEADLAALLTSFDEYSPPAADRFVELLDAKCRLLSQFPEIGRRCDALLPGLRSIVIGRYVVYYRVANDAVQIIRILHAKQDAASKLKEDEDAKD